MTADPEGRQSLGIALGLLRKILADRRVRYIELTPEELVADISIDLTTDEYELLLALQPKDGAA